MTRPDDTAPGQDPASAEQAWRLVERAQAGDADAFALLYDRYVSTIFGFIWSRVINKHVAEDLTADTFLRAMRGIHSIRWQGRDPAAWLTTIARHLVTDHFKSGRNRLEVCTGDVFDTDRTAHGTPQVDPEAVVLDRFTRLAVMRAMARLRPDQRQCLTLRFVQELTVAETARVMGRSEGAIKALQHRALRALARLLGADGP